MEILKFLKNQKIPQKSVFFGKMKILEKIKKTEKVIVLFFKMFDIFGFYGGYFDAGSHGFDGF